MRPHSRLVRKCLSGFFTVFFGLDSPGNRGRCSHTIESITFACVSLAITASNLDEFLEIRVAGLLQHIEDGFTAPQRSDEGGRTPQERLSRLDVILHDFVEAQYACWNDHLLPALRAENIRLLNWRDLDERQREFALAFYENEVDPLPLLPQAVTDFLAAPVSCRTEVPPVAGRPANI